MQTIGLIGGLSWESTVIYYRIINQRVRAERGGLSSAPLLLHSFDFETIVELQKAGAWTEAADRLSAAALGLYNAGARCVAICTNTMHKVAGEVAAALPADARLLHIGDATGAALQAAGIKRVGLMGTRYTMTQPFLSAYLTDRYGIEVVIPEAADREIVHGTIFDELCQGVACPNSRMALVDVARRLRDDQGVEGVVLGCTELVISIGEETGSFPLPRFDTTALHANAIAEYALCNETALPLYIGNRKTNMLNIFSKSRCSRALSLTTALAALALPAAFAQMPGGDAVTVKAAPAATTVSHGGKGELDITVAIKAGYHVNSDAPGDPDLIPATLKLTSGDGITYGKPKFPAAKTITAGGKPIHVFMTKAVVAIPFTVAASAKPGPHKLAATFSYQTCNDTMCLPPADAPVSAVVTVK